MCAWHILHDINHVKIIKTFTSLQDKWSLNVYLQKGLQDKWSLSVYLQNYNYRCKVLKYKRS